MLLLVKVWAYLAGVKLILFLSLFTIQHVHTQPVITTASVTINRPVKAPRTVAGALLFSY